MRQLEDFLGIEELLVKNTAGGIGYGSWSQDVTTGAEVQDSTHGLFITAGVIGCYRWSMEF